MSSPRTSAKTELLSLLEALPDDSSVDDILRELAFHRLILRGLGSVRGRLLTTAEVRRRLKTWTATPV